MPQHRITVVGGGVVGVSSALTILKTVPNCKVTVVAEQFTPGTTGDLAAGLWEPFLIGSSSVEDIIRWSSVTWEQFAEWHRSSSLWGVSMVHGRNLFDEPHAVDYWAHIVQGYAPLPPRQLAKYGSKYVAGNSFTTYFAEPAKFLPILMNEIKEKGGEFIQRRVSSLSDVAGDSDVVVNCTGLSARQLACDDDVVPDRGQVVRVRAPWVTEFLIDNSEETFAYILPNIDCVILGGTHQKDNWSLEEDPETTRTILQRCSAMNPSLKDAEVLGVQVGLRPTRAPGVRLEADQLVHGGRTVPVVHNYGHGGAGITLMWGCAADTANLVKRLTGSCQKSAL